MTGGTPEAAAINQTLARAAQETGIAMGLGSHAAIEHPEQAPTFQVRQFSPDILLLEIWRSSLNYGYGVEHCQRAVDMIGADALILHFNSSRKPSSLKETIVFLACWLRSRRSVVLYRCP
jgi:isopentenyl-diphosphate delta-isomerase